MQGSVRAHACTEPPLMTVDVILVGPRFALSRDAGRPVAPEPRTRLARTHTVLVAPRHGPDPCPFLLAWNPLWMTVRAHHPASAMKPKDRNGDESKGF